MVPVLICKSHTDNLLIDGYPTIGLGRAVGHYYNNVIIIVHGAKGIPILYVLYYNIIIESVYFAG